MAQRKKSPTNDELQPYEITLDGQRIRVDSQLIEIDQVQLDPRNPRIAHTLAVELPPGVDVQAHLQVYLWGDPDVKELYRQVLANGGLLEPIIVRSDHTVAEGNCRTVVYRKLREKQPTVPTWRKIPARVLPPQIDPRLVAMLLGELHVAGKNTWTAFEKAGHVHDLHRLHGLTQSEIATQLRMSKSKVNQLARAFEVMESKYIPTFPGRQAVRKFSYFEELFKNPDLRTWADDSDNLDMFVDWVGRGVISKGAHVRDLPDVIGNKKAFALLKKSGFEAAQEELATHDPSVNSPLFKALLIATTALREARLDDIVKVRDSESGAARKLLRNLDEALADFRRICDIDGTDKGSKRNDDEEE